VTRRIQDLKKLARNVKPVYVLRIGFSDDVGNDGASRLEQLAVELSGNLVSEETPERKVGARQEYPTMVVKSTSSESEGSWLS